ncbi:MAG: type VI secretion system tip protein VgrG [Myxococcales bacterium]|nr:type VI secretion system tip protein VgrG [Myxococcales bacterium]
MPRVSSSVRVLVDTFEDETFDVTLVTGRERISTPYRFDITATARDDEGAVLARAVGNRARVHMEVDGLVRVWSGVVASVRAMGRVHLAAATGATRALYRLRIVERTAILRHRVTSRIFQEITVPEVLTLVLEEHGIKARFDLEKTYPKHDYVTQYRETDLAFAQRLMGEAGLFCRAAPSAEDASIADDVVFGDAPSAYKPLSLSETSGAAPATLYFLSLLGSHLASSIDNVTEFTLRNALRTRATFHRDIDPDRPLTPLECEVGKGDPALGLEAYEHGSDFRFPEWGATGANFGDGEAKRILDRRRRRAVLAAGKTSCVALAPGLVFMLADHPEQDLNQAWAVIDVKHRLDLGPEQSGSPRYESAFEAVPSQVPYPAKRPSRGSIHSAETGTVVGPAGEEIHVDSKARVKVHFHWDRRPRTEKSSCWLRTMQIWSGPGWGSQFIPRVGMEVVVLFEGGDPDRPLVVGTVNNALNPPPYNLPEFKAKSGFRTQSTPKSDGFNELAFDDAAGEEVVLIRAQKDLKEAVLHDRETVIGNDRTTTIQGTSTEVVRGLRTRVVSGGENVTITGPSSFELTGPRTESLNGSMKSIATGDRELSTGGDENSDVQGDRQATVSGSDHVVAKVARSVIVGTPTERSGDSLHFVWGRAMHRTSGVSEFVGDESILLRSGQSSIEILPDRIRISSPTIETVATKEVVMRGGGDGGPVLKLTERAEIMAKQMHFVSESARLSLTKNASVRGEKILLNSDEQALSDAAGVTAPADIVKVALRLFDENQIAYADKPYCIIVGSVTLEGKTDGTGRMSATVPAVAKTGRLIVWKADYPTGPTQEWVLVLAKVGPADSPPDLQKRLANLGFPSGPPVAELTPRLKDALRAYQIANQLDATGEADADTVALLHIIHP